MRNVEVDEVEVTIERKTVKTSKARPGRPKSEKPKNKKVMLSFTEEQHEKLLDLAKKEGRALSNFLIMDALEKIK